MSNTPFRELGRLYLGSNFIIYRNNQGEYFTVSEDTGDTQEFTWNERLGYIFKHPEMVKYYKDTDWKYHCTITIDEENYIDIIEDTVQELFALLLDMIRPSDEVLKYLSDMADQHIEKSDNLENKE